MSLEIWTKEEFNRLLTAIQLYGKCWSKIVKYVGSKSIGQCRTKVKKEIYTGRIKIVFKTKENWSLDEIKLLKSGLEEFGRDWVAISKKVGSKNRHQCRLKVINEVRAKRMKEPLGKRHKRWSNEEKSNLHIAIKMYGRQWKKVAEYVGQKTAQQCRDKVRLEVNKKKIPNLNEK